MSYLIAVVRKEIVPAGLSSLSINLTVVETPKGQGTLTEKQSRPPL